MRVQLDSSAFIEIPFSTDDITFADFCDFKAKEAQFIELLKTDDTEGESAAILIEVIETVVKGDVSELPYSIENDSIIELIERDFMFNFDDEVSILRIYAHVITLLKRVDLGLIVEGKDLVIDNSAEKYTLNAARCVRLMTERNLTAGEMIETLEFQRRFFAVRETAQLQDVANLDFELGLTEVAILCRKEGEKLPHRKAEFDEWLQKRIHEIQHIPLTDVLKIRFFLLNCLTEYVKAVNIGTSSTESRTFTRPSKRVIINRQ